ncbi:hypothetical protein EON63_16285 [archaeon]|nr:MAG: hypothetical protein EON63_16285 [archaeon]
MPKRICVHIHMHTHAHINTHTYTYSDTNTCTYIHIHMQNMYAEHCEDMVWSTPISIPIPISTTNSSSSMGDDPIPPPSNTTTHHNKQEVFSLCMAERCGATVPTKFTPEVWVGCMCYVYDLGYGEMCMCMEWYEVCVYVCIGIDMGEFGV